MQIDFSAAFDMVNHEIILYKLCYVGIGNYVLSILTKFLSNLSQHFMVDGCRSKLVNIMSGVLWGSFLGQFLFHLYTSQRFTILENKLIGYADNSTLIVICCVISGVRATVAKSLYRDLGKFSEWCDLWGMKLYAINTKPMIVSMSRAIYHHAVTLINYLAELC